MAQLWRKTWWLDLMVVLSLLTRIPIKVPENAYDRQAEAVWAYGLIGMLWAAIVWLGCMVGFLLGLPPMVAALIGLALGVILTGAMHEDGLAQRGPLDCVASIASKASEASMAHKASTHSNRQEFVISVHVLECSNLTFS